MRRTPRHLHGARAPSRAPTHVEHALELLARARRARALGRAAALQEDERRGGRAPAAAAPPPGLRKSAKNSGGSRPCSNSSSRRLGARPRMICACWYFHARKRKRSAWRPTQKTSACRFVRATPAPPPPPRARA